MFVNIKKANKQVNFLTPVFIEGRGKKIKTKERAK